MYEIRYYHDANHRYVVIAEATTLQEARAVRKVSGDLVVDRRTDIVVEDPEWLWDWEKTDPRAYATRHLGEHLPGRCAS